MPTAADRPNMIDAAIGYADLGWSVIPLHTPTFKEPGAIGTCDCGKKAECSSPGKHPRTMNGLKDATTDHDQIRKWWGMWPTANIGIVVPDDRVIVDIDGTEGIHAINEAGVEMPKTAVQRTGRGYHYVYSTDEPVRPTVGLLNHVDLRGPGSYVVAAPSVHVSGAVYEWATPMTKRIAKRPDWVAARGARNTASAAVEPGEEVLIRKGERDHRLTSIGGSLRRKGMSEEAIFGALKAMVDAGQVENDDGEVDDAMLKRISRSVARYDPVEEDDGARLYRSGSANLQDAAPPPETGLKRWQIADLLSTSLPEQQWFIEGFLPVEGLGALIGAEKAGKTTLMSQMALCLATGTPFLGMDVIQTPVLFIEEEGTEHAMQYRLRTQAQMLGITVTDDTPLYLFQRQRFRLDHPDWIKTLEEQIHETGARVLLMSPLSQLASVEENDNRAINDLTRLLQDVMTRNHVTPVLAHHRRKESQKEPPTTVGQFFTTARGASALMGAVDTGIGIRRDLEEPNGTLFIMQRAAASRRLGIRYINSDVETLTFEVDPEAASHKGLSKALRLTLEAVEAHGIGKKVTVAEVAEKRTDKASRDTVTRHLDTLFIGGLIGREKAGERKPMVVWAKEPVAATASATASEPPKTWMERLADEAAEAEE